MKKKTKLTALTLIVVLLATIFVVPMQTQTPIATASTKKSTKLSAPDFPKAGRYSDTSIEVWWQKVKGAQGYEIHRKDLSTNKYALLKTQNGKSKTRFIDKNLPERTLQYYKIRAFKTVKKKKQYSGFSYWVSAINYQQGDTVVNAGKVTSSWEKMAFAQRDFMDTSPCEFGETKEGEEGLVNEKNPYKVCYEDFSAQIKPSSWSKAKGKKIVDPNLRFKSSNSSIVAVSKTGVFKSAAKTGTSKIRYIAHDGQYKIATITVKDYIHAKKFDLDLVDFPEAKDFLKKRKNDLINVVSYFTKNMIKPPTGVDFWLDKKGGVIAKPKIKISRNATELLKKLLKGHNAQAMFSISSEGRFVFEVYSNKKFNDPSFYQEKTSYSFIYSPDYVSFLDEVIAPHWQYSIWHYSEDDYKCYFYNKCKASNEEEYYQTH